MPGTTTTLMMPSMPAGAGEIADGEAWGQVSRDFSRPQLVDLVHLRVRRAESCAVLEPGGYFAFDVNNRLSFDRMREIWALDLTIGRTG